MSTEKVEALKALHQSFDLQLPDTISEAEILQQLEKRINVLLERSPEEFLQLLYRLDIPEHKVSSALGNNEAISVLAKLIYDRQLEKAKSRLYYSTKGKPSDLDDDLSW